MSKQNDYDETKKALGVIGIIALVVGAILTIFGGIQIFSVFTTNFAGLDFNGFSQQSTNMMGQFFIGAVGVFIGFVCMGFGYKMILAANIGKISTFFASETSEAASITTEAIGSGLARGINKGGGIGKSKESRETIKIKCRNCGYLETEDAEFCSKCGEPL